MPFSQKIGVRKGGITLAKKHNKRKEQKPNYSKRGKRLDNSLVEAGKDFDLEDKLRKQRDGSSSSDSDITLGGNLSK